MESAKNRNVDMERFSLQNKTLMEPARSLPVAGEYDVIICGGGPAGAAAAIAAGRNGARTLVLESQGCLGGIMTTGMMPKIINGIGKDGFIRELLERLKSIDAEIVHDVCDPESVKYLLERLSDENHVSVRYHTRICQVILDQNSDKPQIQAVITESKSGREAWIGKLFIDCTGDGDIGKFSGCSIEMGHPENGRMQPLSLCAMVGGVPYDRICGFVHQGNGKEDERLKLAALFEKLGKPASYTLPSLFLLEEAGRYIYMSNHQYGVSPYDANALTQATLNARKEIYEQIRALNHSSDEVWKSLKLYATGSHIGVREGGRIKGLYTVTVDDIRKGQRHPDAVCSISAGVDIHATEPNKDSKDAFSDGGIRIITYDIPLRALIAEECSNLLMAGRCISGDFYAHASYRVLGGAIPMGEGAGKYAAWLIKNNLTASAETALEFAGLNKTPNRKQEVFYV